MQELSRTERVRHHCGHGGRERARRELADHFRMPVGGKFQPAVLLRNDHREELVRLEEVPDLRRQVAQFPTDVPVVDHAAELLDRAVEEGLLFRRELGGREGQQLGPVGIAGEQIRIPPDIAGFDGLALGIRQTRQHVLRPPEDRLGNPVPAKCRLAHRGPAPCSGSAGAQRIRVPVDSTTGCECRSNHRVQSGQVSGGTGRGRRSSPTAT